MGTTLLQIGRALTAAIWLVFIIAAMRMALLALPSWPAVVFFLVAAYAGAGMLLGLVFRFIQAQELRP